MKKNVLIFSLQYYPYVGGAEVALKELTDRLGEAYEFHMITAWYDRSLPQQERVGSVLVHRIGLATMHPAIGDLRRLPLHLNKYLYQILAYWEARKLHRIHDYTLVWAMMAHATGIPAGLFKRAVPHVPYVLTLQEGDPLAHIERTMRPVWPLFVQGFLRADRVQAISTFLGAWATRMGFRGIPDIIPNGVDVVRFATPIAEADIEQTRRTLGKKEGDLYLITTSRLVHKNGIDTVVRALALLPEHVIFLVYGIGPDEAKLRTLAQELGVEHRVRFMGQATHSELPVLLRASDIFIRPSRSEGMGNSFIEAMAAGIPVIATQEGGISDFLFDATRNPDKATTGWAVDVDAPEHIAQAVTSILENPEVTARVVQTARTLAQSGYDWNDVAHLMEKLFSDTIISKS